MRAPASLAPISLKIGPELLCIVYFRKMDSNSMASAYSMPISDICSKKGKISDPRMENNKIFTFLKLKRARCLQKYPSPLLSDLEALAC